MSEERKIQLYKNKLDKYAKKLETLQTILAGGDSAKVNYMSNISTSHGGGMTGGKMYKLGNPNKITNADINANIAAINNLNNLTMSERTDPQNVPQLVAFNIDLHVSRQLLQLVKTLTSFGHIVVLIEFPRHKEHIANITTATGAEKNNIYSDHDELLTLMDDHVSVELTSICKINGSEQQCYGSTIAVFNSNPSYGINSYMEIDTTAFIKPVDNPTKRRYTDVIHVKVHIEGRQNPFKFSFIAVHLAYSRRVAIFEQLHNFIEKNLANSRVMLIGDFNIEYDNLINLSTNTQLNIVSNRNITHWSWDNKKFMSLDHVLVTPKLKDYIKFTRRAGLGISPKKSDHYAIAVGVSHCK